MNKHSIFVTFEVSNLDKSKYSISLHSLNIIDISVTLLVLILFNPLISFNWQHPLNILDILLTFELLKFVKSKEIIFSQSSKRFMQVLILSLKTILNLYFPSFLNTFLIIQLFPIFFMDIFLSSINTSIG